MGWLNKFSGRNAAGIISAFSRLQPGDEVRSGDETWKVTAVLVYRSGDERWPAAKLARGQAVTWAVLEGDHVVRYDPVTAQVDAEGRARWNGRVYTREAVGTAVIDRAVGDVDVHAGDTLSYQVLCCPDDPGAWISVEYWVSSYVEVSVGRNWSVDEVVTAGQPA